MRRSNAVRATWVLVVAIALAALALLSIAIGSREVSFDDLVAGLMGGTDNLGQAAIVKRVPRTALALLIGAALGLAGAVMQGVTRNPLADPSILGINMGASLAVVIGISWFGLVSAIGYIWVAIAGAAVTAVAVYAIGSLGRGGATPLKLALAGSATTAALASLITAISLPRGDVAEMIRSWQIGGVGGASWESTGNVVAFFAVGAIVCLISARSLNALALGDDVAASLGEHVAVVRGIAAVGAVMLCGAATAVAGPIAFVGLVVPHFCRLLVGPDYRWLLPFSALGGGVLLVAADVLGRVIARPSEIDVGIITAIVGAPFFIAVVRRQRMRAL
ncbi:iron ABC transporter permease [Pseudoclavibacter endophyticus]|uniref:Iron ABC transporter permease n=1 Tax=Pseudoclavibacter endophyticus TaxID=1778590 RepID=A0A6H9WV29_9MICO|nr:iron ABC transporter permease [Pseudoclavibacter endophyticus]KAB1650505.1 iron ABC transporter permease [Pseudoclavibacter endophyticus]